MQLGILVLVKMKNHSNKFIELYSPYLDEQKIPGLYESILHGINSLPPNTKRDAPEKPLKYRYPMIKGVSEFPVKQAAAKKRGGKKTIKKRNKKTKKNKKRNTRRKNRK
jgi:hypothetical protein